VICGKRVPNRLVLRSQSAYRFLHDRVQEAAYSQIPAELRATAHLRIGRTVLAHTPPENREDAIFEIVNHFNRGAALITSRQERDRVAELNLIAGQRAKSSGSYTSALIYFVAGAAFLANDPAPRTAPLTCDQSPITSHQSPFTCFACERPHDLTFALEVNRGRMRVPELALGRSGSAVVELSNRAQTGS